VTWEEVLAYCLDKPGAWRDEPWEGDVVAKVGSKIFAFLGTAGTAATDGTAGTAATDGTAGAAGTDGTAGTGSAVGVKCGPNREVADEWVARFPDDAYASAYIGRSGWNTLRIGGAIPDDELLEAIDASYETIVSKLPKRERPS
jgi:predicted DNA-binding protein (MmcQ/YjbR family)